MTSVPADAQVVSPRSPVAGGGLGSAAARPPVVETLSPADLEVLRSKKVAVFGSFQVCRRQKGRRWLLCGPLAANAPPHPLALPPCTHSPWRPCRPPLPLACSTWWTSSRWAGGSMNRA